jgi:TPR repeat protein
MPQYVALLARALTAAGRLEEALPHFRDAASRGNLRALVTMGLLSETGQGVPRDPAAALSYYEKAADGGSPDGAINLAVALLEGRVTKRDVPRALALLNRASEAGSAIATYNLGVLAQDGIGGTPTTAMDHFKKAASLRDPRAFRAAAVLLDEGRGVPKDPSSAAEYLLQGIVSDAGETLNELQTRAGWSKDTIRMVQTRLRAAGFYSGPTDGRSNPTLNAALRRWRDAGSLDRLQRS